MASTVTNPTGTVSGKDLSKLVDAYAGHFGGYLTPPTPTNQAQWQYALLLSDMTGACARKGSGGDYGASELTLQFAHIGYADLDANAPFYPPADAFPLTIPAGGWVTTSDRVHRYCGPSVMQATRQGKPGNAIEATAGSVIYTRIDSTQVEVQYSLTFGSDSASGSFVAPWCGAAPPANP